MNQIIKILMFLIFTIQIHGQTKTNLPFIGTRSFNFPGGSCCEETITIYKNGKCILKAYQAPEFGNKVVISYSGKFSNVIWFYSKRKKVYGYKIEKEYITRLRDNGKPEIGCRDDNVPCKVDLYEWEN